MSHDPFKPHTGYQRIWHAVILQALTDLSYTGRDYRLIAEKEAALAWIDTPDFRIVSSIAGFDPSWLQRQFKLAVARGINIRVPAGKGHRFLERKRYRMKVK